VSPLESDGAAPATEAARNVEPVATHTDQTIASRERPSGPVLKAEADLCRWASQYAVAGLPVLPLRPAGKLPLTAHGLHDATADPHLVAEWWRRWPTANVGVRTGDLYERGRLLVIDLDGAEGEQSWAALVERQGPVETLTSTTGRGRHLWLTAPADRPLGNSAGRLGPGVDTRGRGGYVLVPPSVHPSGRRYRWSDCRNLAAAPPWLPDRLDPPPRPVAPVATPARATAGKGRGPLGGLVQTIFSAPEGTRNSRLYWSACRLAEHVAAGSIDPGEGAYALSAAARAVGLDDREAAATLASARRGVQP